MNRQLESLFDLPPAESFAEPEPPKTEIVESASDTPLFDRVNQALPQVRGLGVGEQEVDEIADEAMKSYQEIKELAMNLEPKYSSELLAVAASLLQTALTARQGKTDTKLKAVRLQLQAYQAQQKSLTDQNNATVTQGKIVGNRNQLIADGKKLPDKA